MARDDLCRVIGSGRVGTPLPARDQLLGGFAEADPGLDEAAARAEAGRCTAASPCLYCEVCQLICPDLAITRDAERHIVIDLAYCKGCGLCARYCPHGAIEMVVDD